ncbi:MAG: hypothetical protein JW722_03875 [Demequinaceae bacterium]|nr:hypothetical protein [Demequinaceae bacterium]
MAEGWAAKADRLLGERGRELYCLAFALTGAHPSARSLLHESLGKAFTAATKKTAHEDVTVYARRAVYSAFLEASKRKPGHRKSHRAPAADADPFLTALSALDAQQRLCIVMRFYEGLSCAAIAKDLDVLPTTIRRYLSSAVERLGRPLSDLGLTEQQLHFGGWTPGNGDSGVPQEVPTDTLSIGFTHVDSLALAGYGQALGDAGSKPLVKAATRPRRGRAWAVAALTVSAIGSLGIGGWTAVQAFVPSVEAVAPSPSPSSPYGMGVLASDNLLADSESWYTDTGAQRLLVCEGAPWDPNGVVDDGGIPVTSDDFGSDRNSLEMNVLMGTCKQRQTEAASVSATIVPITGTSGRTSVRALVTLTNTGDHSIAILRDSIGLYFELPWGALSYIQSSRDTQIYLTGSSLNAPSLDFIAVASNDTVILAPGEELAITFSTRIIGDSTFERMIEDPEFEATPEMIEEWRRAMSIIGELSEFDPILPAFRAGEYIPPAGLSIVVAPSNPESTQFVAIWVVHDQVGEPPAEPEPSPTPSPSPSPSPNVSATA